MRMRMFFVLFLSLCVVEFNVNAAVNQRGNARGTAIANNAGAQQSTATNAARAAKRGTSVVKPNTNSQPAASAAPKNGDITKRAATNNTPVKKPMAARAGATQKVIQTGSKVAAANTNNTVPQECQDAFYGCMDSFCMLDNASGGRCQCNDAITELDAVLEDILKLDEQTYIMATEGVERIKMGEAEAQIMARAKAAADKVTVDDKKAEDAKKKVRQLDLSAWNKTIFDEDEDDIFADVEDDSDLVDTFINKKGDALYKSAANMCMKAFPDQCKQYGSMVQLVYAQRIRSDCIAYENSLKQQKNASAQKLQTAQKALRDAALEEYRDQNKYGTVGECAVAFAQCMQTTAECGSDYTGCVTLAAKENVRSDATGKKATQTTIKGVVSGADITLAASTMESLLAKKEICMHVTKQCVNANKNDAVWNVFLRNAAPALKSAEEIAEQNLRMQCISSVADCYKTACKSQIDPNDEEGSYDMCLSQPKIYKSLCKVQLEPCLNATGGTYEEPEKSFLWNGLVAALNAMKVDACTNQVRTCLTERCGEDYSGCVGLDTESIGLLCPIDKLTACVSDSRFARDTKTGEKNEDNIAEIRAYIAEIAQGLAVQIDNSMMTVCQKALEDSMIKVCGDTETCDVLTKDEKLGARSLKYEVCVDGTCHQSFDEFTKADLEKGNWTTKMKGEFYWANIDYDFDNGEFTSAEKYISSSRITGDTKDVYDTYNKEVANLQSAIKNAIGAIESDPKVVYCMTGRKVQGFDSNSIGVKKVTKTVTDGKGNRRTVDVEETVARFPSLTDQKKRIIISYALKAAREKYDEKYEEEYERLMTDQAAAVSKLDREVAIAAARKTCKAWGDGKKSDDDKSKDDASNEDPNSGHSVIDEKTYKATINTIFNEETGVCTKETVSQNCEKRSGSNCKQWEDPKTTTQTMNLI